MTAVPLRRLLTAAWRAVTRVAPERRLAAATAAAAALWYVPGPLGPRLAQGALAVLAIAVLLDWLLLPPAAAIRIDRRVPPVLGAGDDETGLLIVASHVRRRLVVTVGDRLPALLCGGVGRATVALPPAGRAEVPFPLLATRRGRHALGPVGARVTTSLGLVRARVVADLGDHVDVLPSVRAVARFRWLATQHRLDAMGIRALRRRGEGRSFAGLREYVLGDDPRHLDWKATARRGKPIVREYTIERSQDVLVVLDAGRGMTQVEGAITRFDHALTAALVLADVAATAGDRVGALVFDDRIRAFVPADRARGALKAIRDAVMPVEPTLAESDYAQAFRQLAAVQRKRALLVVFTDVLDVRASRALLAHVSHGAVRHLALVVALRNEALVAAADGAALPPADAPRDRRLVPYERAAAEELVQARAEALERMRRAGAIVLDVSPRQMTAAIVNEYLALKARGAL